jgi:hypothetical protein
MKTDELHRWLKMAAGWRALPGWLVLAGLAAGTYLGAAALGYGVAGFPLDDAWIHQTYARNLAATGQWAFVPGQISAGSTSPLWSLLLGLGYWIGLPYQAWTYALGILALALTGWTVARLGTALFPAEPWVGPLAGLLCVWEWHLVWAAVSGMETIWFIWLSVLLVEYQMANIKYQISNVKRPEGRLRSQTSNVKPATSNLQLLISNLQSLISNFQFDIWYLRFGLLGLIGGLLALTRPEGLVLVGLTGLATGWALRRAPARLLRAWAALAVGLALPLAPYLFFHYSLTGLPFPNTFYAKQQEYRAVLALYPFWQRWLMVAAVTLIGGQVILLPGFVVAIGRAMMNLKSQTSNIKYQAPHREASLSNAESQAADSRPQTADRRPQTADRESPTSNLQPLTSNLQSPSPNLQSLISNTHLLLAAWWVVHLTLYALRLPVTYQHGRYQMPVIPFFILLGLGGTAYLLRPAAQALLPRVVSRATLLAIMAVSVAFLGLGARAYAADVAFIQGEMVATARWLEEHTSPGSLIAVHDIGAVGYFTRRPLLDLAGLVTPEVIPFIADETRLVEFMQSRGAEYVVFFPDWSDAYQRMAHDPRLEMVHTTGFAWTLSQGRANMTVYRLQPR